MLQEADFAFVAREMKARSGAVLSRETNAVAETRLMPLSRREGFSSVAEMIMAAKQRSDGALWGAIADALIQTETRFYRDRETFRRLRHEILPDLFMRRGGLGVRIWCAGCGSGQEPYSIAMMIDEMRGEGLGQAQVFATDISERLLDRARTGLYTQFEVQRGLPIRKLIAHFEKAADLWRISDRMRASVQFEQHNLLVAPKLAGAFDLVLCCNVMNSFEHATKLGTIGRLTDTMAPDGVLILGHGETLPDGVDGLSGEGGVFTRTPTRRAAA